MTLLRGTVVLSHPNFGGHGTNSWHMRLTTPAGDNLAQATACMEVVRNFYDDLRDVLHIGLTARWDGSLVGVGADEGDSHAVAGWTVTGNNDVVPMPPCNAVVFGWRTGTGGRHGKGRTFVSPFVSTLLEGNGTIVNTHLENLRVAAAEVVDGSAGVTGAALGVFSREEGILRDFTGSQVTDQISVLRSRRD